MAATALFLLYLIFTLIILSNLYKPVIWEIGSAMYLIIATFVVGLPWFIALPVWIIIIGIALIIRVEPLRNAISAYLYQTVGKTLPKLSKTEEEALSAGETWVEKDIFTGNPDWDALAKISSPLTQEEQSFLDSETRTLCAMLDEWDISQKQDLPKKAWDFIKDNGFFGMVIAKEYGGKGFSARAHSDVVMKIASRSGVAAVTVMVPNSLGPGELLQHYGTEKQKSHYLPRLAKGIDIPCFALTEPGAGSDATSIKSEAVVIKEKGDGKTGLSLKITLDKRWITLAPVATLVGVAVNVSDPDGLLNGNGQEGITCLLLPHDTENLILGNRHLPANQPFMNGTVRGENIIVPIDSIIGGQEQAGNGWRMLVECLSIGRSISLPALSAASSAISYLATGAFSRIRRQFNIEIAQFEGVEEKLAEIAGLIYIVNATRLLTLAAVDQNKKPSVASAITKYFNTELARTVINDAIDVHAGRAVVIGPRNYMTNFYQGIPISVTVEGANIMTRNLLIFGQGSMACHPYIRDEFYALSQKDESKFNEIIWKHINYFFQNLAKAVCSAWTGGIFTTVPDNALSKQYKRLTRLSHAFAWLADLSLITLGGSLKRRERLSARLADGMSYLYLAKAVLHYYQQHKNDNDQALHAEWATAYCFYHAQKSLLAFCANFPNRFLGAIARFLVFPFGQSMAYPCDKIDKRLAKLMTQNNSYRDELIQSVYLSGDKSQPVDRMEVALQAILKHDDLYKKIDDLRRFKFGHLKEKLAEKVNQGDLTPEEMNALIETEKLRWDAIQVDEFTYESMKHMTFSSVTDKTKSPLD